MQGNLFVLLQAEREGITWKSYLWNLPRGVLKFALMTWRHDSVLKHIVSYLKSALESLGTVEEYCDLEGPIQILLCIVCCLSSVIVCHCFSLPVVVCRCLLSSSIVYCLSTIVYRLSSMAQTQ
jgi:hypothetical protein